MAFGVMEGMSIYIVEVTPLSVQKGTEAYSTEGHSGISSFRTYRQVRTRMYRVDNVRLGFCSSAISMDIGPDFGLDARGMSSEF
jgi:hypothetical protein